ncbi:MAG: sulfite exporter TauE/SafE family protein [Pseudomonadota bacterium]
MTMQEVAILIGVGLFGGAWNSVAGGATLFTFPALMATGLPPVVANATNVLALMPANAFALLPFRAELRAVGTRAMPLLAVSGAGAVTGALLLLFPDPAVFEALIPWLVLLATLLFASADRLRLWLLAQSQGWTGKNATYPALFVGSIYGGYFGAGLGFLLLALAQIIGFRDFHTANVIKNLLSTVFMILSVVVFSAGGLVAWPEALAMMFGTSLGGLVGAKAARFLDPDGLRWIVVGLGVILCLYYFAATYWPVAGWTR